jgi:hypothetical protein
VKRFGKYRRKLLKDMKNKENMEDIFFLQSAKRNRNETKSTKTKRNETKPTKAK